MPRPIATGARRLFCTAPPSTSGNNGKTQGDSVVRLPASTLSPKCPREISMARYRALPSAFASALGSVSPASRAVSVFPLKTIRVDWLRTPMVLFNSRSLS